MMMVMMMMMMMMTTTSLEYSFHTPMNINLLLLFKIKEPEYK